MTQPNNVTLRWLLYDDSEPKHVAQLAEAIDRCGIYSYDKSLVTVVNNDHTKTKALEVLSLTMPGAGYFAFDKGEGFDTGYFTNPSTDSDLLRALQQFWWPNTELPNFSKPATTVVEAATEKLNGKWESSLLKLIAQLLIYSKIDPTEYGSTAKAAEISGLHRETIAKIFSSLKKTDI